MVSAAILAGGTATRFGGRDKGALLVGGRSIRDRQLDELFAVSDDVLIVRGADAGGPGAAGHRAREPRVVHDRVAGGGPLGGIHAALTEARGDAVFVVACDMPFVTAAFAGHLLALARGADIVVPRDAGGYHPLCAVYTRACAGPAARRLARGELKMAGLFADVRTHVVEEAEIERFGTCARLLANVNTPADYGELEALPVHRS